MLNNNCLSINRSCANSCGHTCSNACSSTGCASCGGCSGQCGCQCSNCQCGCANGTSGLCSCVNGANGQCCGGWQPQCPVGSALVPRIVGCGRSWQRNTSVTLCVEDLPDCAEPPFTLLSVVASGPVSWDFTPGDCRCTIVTVTIPVLCRVRDACGNIRTGHSTITADVPVRMAVQDRWHHQVVVVPGVRLACNPVSCDDACFTCSLEVLVEVYMTRWDVGSDSITAPHRPQLPLYPQPCCR